MMIHNELFSATNHRGILIPKQANINLEYLKHIIEPIFRQTKKGRLGVDGKNEYTALPPFMIKDIKIPLPIKYNKIDLDIQNKIVEKIKLTEELKLKIKEYKNYIKNINIEIENNFNYKEVKINDIFDIQRGRVISKKYINENQGKYPVYSSSGKNTGIFGYIDSFNFDCEGLTWAIDGYAGKTFYRNGRFSMTNLCGLLTIKNNTENTNNINLNYINHILEPILRGKAKGRKGEKGQSEFTKVYPSMIKDIKIPLPTKYNKVDLEIQNKIVEKYQTIDNIKISIENELTKIEKLLIEY